jgi:hypothetical protein
VTQSLRSIGRGIVLAALSFLVGCAQMPAGPAPGVTTTVILLRHAERPTFGENLTEAGRARAAALPAAVAKYDIAAIYSPDMARNRETARPLAEARGLVIKTVNEWDALDHMLNEQPGKVVMWVGNTGNLTKIYEQLGGTGRPPVGYGDLFIVAVREGRAATVTESHFGK